MKPRGRPRGSAGRCSFCGKLGHNARGGTCSGAALAQELVRQGWSQTEAAAHVGVSPSTVSERIRRPHLTEASIPPVRPGTHIEEHW